MLAHLERLSRHALEQGEGLECRLDPSDVAVDALRHLRSWSSLVEYISIVVRLRPRPVAQDTLRHLLGQGGRGVEYHSIVVY